MYIRTVQRDSVYIPSHAFNFGSMNYRHFRIQKFSIVLKMLKVQISRSMDHAPFGLFV